MVRHATTGGEREPTTETASLRAVTEKLLPVLETRSKILEAYVFGLVARG